MLNDAHIIDLVPGYVLGSLAVEEAQLVAEHLAGCYLCRAELDAFQRVADQLPLALPEAAPPVELKSRLMERIGSLNGEPTSQAVRWQFSKRLFPVGALAGLFLILLLAFSSFLLWQRLNTAEVLTGPLGMRAIALQNTDAAPGASGFVVISADGEDGVLVVDDLPSLDEAREYQVWLVKDGHPQRLDEGVFSVAEGGYRGMRINASDSLLTYSSVWVTIEPVGGSNEPTGERVLDGSLFNR